MEVTTEKYKENAKIKMKAKGMYLSRKQIKSICTHCLFDEDTVLWSTGVSSILSTGGCVVGVVLLSAIVGLRTLLSQTCTEVVDNTVISHRLIHTRNVMKHSKQVIIEKIATSARTLVKLTTRIHETRIESNM